MNDNKENTFMNSIQKIQKYLKLIEINKKSTKISTTHYVNQLEENILTFYNSKLQLIGILQSINTKENDIVYQRTLSSTPESYFTDDLLVHIKNILTFLHSYPIFFADVLQRSRTQTQIKSIINYLQINYINNIFSINEISQELFIIIAFLFYNDITLVKNDVNDFLAKDCLIKEILMCLLNLEQVQIFLYNILNPLLKEILKYQNIMLTFTSEELQQTIKQTNKNQINITNNHHTESINDIYEIIDESDPYLKSIKECYYLHQNSFVRNSEKRELLNNSTGISLKHLKERYKQCTDNISKEIFEGYINAATIDSICFSNVVFNNSINNLKNVNDIKNLQKKNGYKIVDLIECFLHHLTKNIDKMPSILKQLCLLIKELAIICIPNIKEIQIYTLIGKFLFHNFILFALNDSNHTHIFNNEINNNNSIHNIKTVICVLQKLFDLSLFNYSSEPQFTILNSYFITIIPSIVNIYSKIVTNNEQLCLPKYIINEIVQYNSKDNENKFNNCVLNNNNEELVPNELLVVSNEGLLLILKLFLSTKSELRNKFNNKVKNNEIESLLESIDRVEDSITYLQVQYEHSLLSKTIKYFLIRKSNCDKLTFTDYKKLLLSNTDSINSNLFATLIKLFSVMQDIPYQITPQNINELILQIDNYLTNSHYEEKNINNILFDLKQVTINIKEEEILTVLNEIENKLNHHYMLAKTNFEDDLLSLQDKITLSHIQIKNVIKMIHIYENIYCNKITNILTEKENIIVKLKIKKDKGIIKAFLKEIQVKKYKEKPNIVKSLKQFCEHFINNIDIPSYYSKSYASEHYELYRKSTFPIILNNYLKIVFTKTDPLSLKLLKPIAKTENDQIRLLNIINTKLEEYVFIRLYDKLYNLKYTTQDDLQCENSLFHLKTLDINNCILGLNESQYTLIKNVSTVFNKIIFLKTPKSIMNLISFVNKYIEERINNVDITKLLFYYITKLGYTKYDSLLQYLELFLIDGDKYKTIINSLHKIKDVLIKNVINNYDETKDKKNFEQNIRNVLSSK